MYAVVHLIIAVEIYCLRTFGTMAALKLYISGAINQSDLFFWFFGMDETRPGDVKNATDTANAIRDARGQFDSIELTIVDCPGGSVTQATGMYDLLRGQGVPVITRTVGMCASAATILLAAGDERYSTPLCRFLIHEGRFSYIESATAGSLRDAADYLDSTNSQIADLYVEATGGKKSKEEWLAEMARDRFTTAKEMQDFGLVTKIDQYVPLNVADISEQFNILKLMSNPQKGGLLERLFGKAETVVETPVAAAPIAAEVPATPPAPTVEAVTKEQLDAVVAQLAEMRAEHEKALTELATRDTAKTAEIQALKEELAAKTQKEERLAALPQVGQMAAPENVAKTVVAQTKEKYRLSDFVGKN